MILKLKLWEVIMDVNFKMKTLNPFVKKMALIITFQLQELPNKDFA